MAIQIADGFQLRVAKPLDDRQNVETVAQLDPTYGYEGQIVYVKDIKQFYTCYKDENGSLAYKVMETGSSTPNESAGIELWVSGESYEENDFVSYNDYIYRCKIANNDTDFVEDNWQKQSDTHVEITEQEILDLLDLTDEELETMAHLIDDSAISLNKTYSSSKIYTDIQQCLEDSKTYTLEELEKVKIDDTLTTTDKTITGAINEVNGNLLDTVGFSADYKNIILNRKNGLNPYTIPISTIINNASLAELKDVDSTDVGNGKTLVYDSSIQKHRYVNTTGTDEFVKMDSTTDANYLSNLIDKSTVVNDNGVLKVKKLDGQEVTITEINYLKGLTMNVMDLVNAFSNGGVKVLNTPLNTASELDTMDRTSFTDGISYIVYVLADETHSNAKTTYLCTKTSTTFFGNADSQRNFTTNPIDLANEVTGKLGTSNIDVDSLWTLLTINDTYKTLTTNNEIFGTHGAKAMYDELLTEIGAKANATDLTTHTNNTDIHVTTTDKAKWNKVIDKVNTTDFNSLKTTVDGKVDKDKIVTVLDGTVTDEQVPSAKATYDLANTKANASIITMVDLGFTKAEVPLEDFMVAISKNMPKNFSTIYKVAWSDSRAASVVFGDKKVNINGGTLYCSQNNIVTNDWVDLSVLYVPLSTTSSNIYKFIARNSDRDMSVYMYEYPNMDDSSNSTTSTWSSKKTSDEIAKVKDELFQSVSSGKTLVANAITDKGVSTPTTATFATMATNISKISGCKEETKSYNNTSSGTALITLTFSANVLGVKQIKPPTYSSRISTQTSGEVVTISGKELTFYVTGAGTWEVTALIK